MVVLSDLAHKENEMSKEIQTIKDETKAYHYGFAAYGRFERPCDDPQYMEIFNRTESVKASLALAAMWLRGHDACAVSLALHA